MADKKRKTSVQKKTSASKRKKSSEKKPTTKIGSKTGSVKKTGRKKVVKLRYSAVEEKRESDVLEEVDQEAIERGDSPMNVVGHLDELRSRLMVSVLTIIIITLASFVFSEEILKFLEGPYSATGLRLNVFNITEGFLLRLKASLMAGILLGLPVILFEIWRYIAPAINREDRGFARISMIAAVILFFGGISVTFFIMLPFAIKMLLSFTPEGMQNMQNASNYVSFVFLFSFAMGALFELPIIIMILTRLGIVSPEFLIRKRKYAIVLIFIVAAILTPPDVLTQLMLALPLVLLYEISIFISKFVVMRKKKKAFKYL